MIALFGLMLAAGVAAEETPQLSEGDDPQLYACVAAAGAVDPAMQECWRQFAEREDARLNHNWRILLRKAGGSETDTGRALLAEQRAWLAFQDASCQHFLNGTLDRVQQQICFTRRVTWRADELADMVVDLDGY